MKMKMKKVVNHQFIFSLFSERKCYSIYKNPPIILKSQQIPFTTFFIFIFHFQNAIFQIKLKWI